MMTPSTSEKRRKQQFVRAELERTPKLTPRDLSVLNTIHRYGGVMTTVQLALLFFGPSLPAKLKYVGLDPAHIQDLLARFPAVYLNDKIEGLKFFQRGQKLLTGQPPASSSERQLGRWLEVLQTNDPAQFAELVQAAKQVAGLKPKDWLVAAIEQDDKLPAAYWTRPITANEFVSSACITRLRALYDAGWVDKDEPATKLHQGRGQTLWFLSRQGRTYLANLHQVLVSQLPWKQAGSFGDQHLPHRLATNDFRISLTLAAERLGYEIKIWRNEDELRRTHMKQKLTMPADLDDPDSKLVDRWLVPDAYFWLKTDKDWFHMIEIDRGTETLQYTDTNCDLSFWSSKLCKYREYMRAWYEQAYPEAEGRGRILVVTTSDTRLSHMAEVTREVAGKAAGRYWFTTFQRLAPTYRDYFNNAILTDKIWMRADTQEWRTLVW